MEGETCAEALKRRRAGGAPVARNQRVQGLTGLLKDVFIPRTMEALEEFAEVAHGRLGVTFVELRYGCRGEWVYRGSRQTTEGLARAQSRHDLAKWWGIEKWTRFRCS